MSFQRDQSEDRAQARFLPVYLPTTEAWGVYDATTDKVGYYYHAAEHALLAIDALNVITESNKARPQDLSDWHAQAADDIEREEIADQRRAQFIDKTTGETGAYDALAAIGVRDKGPAFQSKIIKADDKRAKIDFVNDAVTRLAESNPDELSVSHFFGAHLAIKEVRINTKFAMIGKHVHDYTHYSLLARGTVILRTSEGDETKETLVIGPRMIKVPAGVQHEIQAYSSDVVWYCIHGAEWAGE